jgi:DNA-binding response OmpR family regulator
VSELIVVVDDDTALLTLIEMMLRRSQFRVMTLDDPRDVLDLINSVTPNLFILDVMMPRINGIELCKQIRSNPRASHVPIIMLSAMGISDNFNKVLEAGADVFLSKSSLHHDLVSNVQKLIRRTADYG